MTNKLIEETSPYLLQHASNPVDWHAWNEPALELARRTAKPILLSIGYSACHWCHVMAHESFEDPDTAELMNRLYVNIKVDREERPDIDRIYQTAHQLLAGQAGGWPLTVFLTPDAQVPIFTGTYFPKERRYGMPSFTEVLKGISNYTSANSAEIDERGAALIHALNSLNDADNDFTGALNEAPLLAAVSRLAQTFDADNGGFGGAPKFPHASNLELLLDASCRDEAGDAQHAMNIVTFTLTQMANSGLYDHLGGGFFRYCVDADWTIPHFEKMLYDNAALLGLYSDAATATGDADYQRVAAQTADWVIRDMQAPDGAFYATLDADSEGTEGKFYVWTPAQVDQIVSSKQMPVIAKIYGLDEPANFEGRHWHLLRRQTVEQTANILGIDGSDVSALLAAGCQSLLTARNGRVWPTRDEKRLVAWNGLMIAGLAKASRRLRRPDLGDAAMRAVDFIRQNMLSAGRLRASFKDGRARFAAYLDDYACLALGLLELLQCRWRNGDLTLATTLLDTMLDSFADPAGGFFFTADDHEKLIYRPKPWADESIPAGNGVAATALQAFGHLLGEQRYLEAADRTVRAALPRLEQYPEAHATMLRALRNELVPPAIIVVRGRTAELAQWQATLDSQFAASRYSFCIPADASGLPGLLSERQSADRPTAYYCEGTSCRKPVTSIDALQRLMTGA